MFARHLITSLLALIVFTLITGLVYPLLVTGIARLAFPEKAGGSLIAKDGRILGSRLIGQPFSSPKYFWSRPSATSPFPYNAASSAGSNDGPTSPALLEEVEGRIAELKKYDSLTTLPIPADLVTSSGSGLDPDISVAGAIYQVGRVARARGLREEFVRALVDSLVSGREIGILGEGRVNVLRLNMALDAHVSESARN